MSFGITPTEAFMDGKKEGERLYKLKVREAIEKQKQNIYDIYNPEIAVEIDYEMTLLLKELGLNK